MNLEENLNKILSRYDELQKKATSDEVINSPKDYAVISKELSEILPTVELIKKFKKVKQEIKDSNAIIEDTKSDNEMKEMAKSELENLISTEKELEKEIQIAVLPKDKDDSKNAVLEVRAGTGGDEAGLFAADLLRMYQRYCEARNLRLELIHISETGVGGIKESIFEVSGEDTYKLMRHESGVHRVQRVPATESQGRIHTSTATVAVLPKAEAIDIEIKPDEIRIDIFHAGGHGGQNVNKVATAVRITHLSTGLVVTAQRERSQAQNRQIAMDVLRARLWDAELRRQQESISANRRAQVGSGNRSEKIRTYNFPQDRMTDHRVNLSVHGLPEILAGQGRLDDVIESLLQDEQARLLEDSDSE